MANVGQIAWTTPAPTGTPYICVADHKTAASDGGTFTSGAWRTRDLNTIVADTHSVARLAGNRLTLPAGPYRCQIRCPAFVVGLHQARLQNITDGTTILTGSNSHSDQTATEAQTDSWVVGWFRLLREVELEVQHQCSNTRATNGFGAQNSFGTEVYTVAQFWREAG